MFHYVLTDVHTREMASLFEFLQLHPREQRGQLIWRILNDSQAHSDDFSIDITSTPTPNQIQRWNTMTPTLSIQNNIFRQFFSIPLQLIRYIQNFSIDLVPAIDFNCGRHTFFRANLGIRGHIIGFCAPTVSMKCIYNNDLFQWNKLWCAECIYTL